MVPVKPEIANAAKVSSLEEYQETVPPLARQAGGILARADRAAALVQQAPHRLRLGHGGGGLLLVRRRSAQRLLQLRRPPPGDPAGQDGDHLGQGRARRVRAHHLPGLEAPRGADRQRAAPPRRAPRRPGGDLPADGAGARLHHAGVRPDRRRPLGGLRRLLGGVAARADHRRPVQDADHRQRGPARRQEDPAQGDLGPGDRGPLDGRDGARGAPHRHRRRDGAGPRLLARRRGPEAALHLPERVDGLGEPAVRPLHLRLDRQAQGRAPHHRRVPALRGDDPRVRLRPEARRRLHVRRRHRLDHRPQLHRLRPAGQRLDDGDVRVDAGLPGRRSLLAGGRRPGGQHLLHRADGDPGDRPRGRRLGRRSTSGRACASWARSASRSTRRSGSGTTTWSARAAPRWSTPGGRPRPAGF